MNLDALLTLMRQRLASDLHLREGRPPLMRVGGDLLPTEHPVLDSNNLWNLIAPALNETLVAKLETEREVDIDYEVPGVARFRLNVFYSKARIGAVIRLIPLDVPTIDMLGLPPVLKDLSVKPHGLFLVTGPTGSGKSTTLASCVEHINQTRHCHVITIEDPIEFVYQDKKATITQRALGRDSLDHKRALRAALRQDPDVILAGEMRDRETMELAIHAAETGHLVLSTLHTNDAKQTIDRILDSFPADVQKGVRRMLSVSLVGVVCQRLIKRASGQGRIPALEILVNSPAIRELIEKGDTMGMDKTIASSQSYWRMQTFNQSLAQLVQDRLILPEEALK
ncbi:MAG: PilT/PilU family type 4a pilus ATPase, partial [Planctomycetota bacterium]|nr:PilT/PilU family type 4a pilus ATPase [Planctomycetota bacterium]